jgi:hypothetical protein
MAGLDGKMQSSQYEGYRTQKLIPLVIRYATGTPSIVQNPTNEEIALTDTGTGDLKLTLASASLSPLIVPGIGLLPAAAGTLGLLPNLKSAPTTTVVEILVNSGADGATETDPVDLHVLIVKHVLG